MADKIAVIGSGLIGRLGLRWPFMGPFETIDLNAPGGVADYIALRRDWRSTPDSEAAA